MCVCVRVGACERYRERGVRARQMKYGERWRESDRKWWIRSASLVYGVSVIWLPLLF